MTSIIDLIFPKICVGCKGEGSWLCDGCLRPLFLERAPSCADCDRLTSDGRYCRFHADDHATKGLIYVGSFAPGPLREAIHVLKYNYVRELSKPLGWLLQRRLGTYPIVEEAIVVPVPLHKDRQLERGFNQAELIAKELIYPVYTDLLVRWRKTKPQAVLTHAKRAANVSGVFGVKKEKSALIAKKTVILLDDVATTGSTLDSAAAILKKAGAKAVWGAVIAKG